MLDTPLVRGERGVFVPLVGGVRLDMALERKERRNEYLCGLGVDAFLVLFKA
jgi:hypothetical protein